MTKKIISISPILFILIFSFVSLFLILPKGANAYLYCDCSIDISGNKDTSHLPNYIRIWGYEAIDGPVVYSTHCNNGTPYDSPKILGSNSVTYQLTDCGDKTEHSLGGMYWVKRRDGTAACGHCYPYVYSYDTGSRINTTSCSPGTRHVKLIVSYGVSGCRAVRTFSFTMPEQNHAPTIQLYYPVHNVWYNHPVTFGAKIWDKDFPNDKARAYFAIDHNNPTYSGWGGWVDSNGDDSDFWTWSMSNMPDGKYWWRAYARDKEGNESDWTGYRLFKLDRTKPTAHLDQENGISPDTSIWVKLSESDNLSGVAQGDVDVRINNGKWQNYSSTINDFNYTGKDGNTYAFRYRVKDNAGNWSDFSYDGSVTIELNSAPTATPKDVLWACCSDSLRPTVEWKYSDPDNDPEESYQVQFDDNSNFSSPEYDSGIVNSDSTAYHPIGAEFEWNTRYYWRVRAKDNHGNWSNWGTSSLLSFKTPLHAYPEPDFDHTPISPLVNQPVQFSDKTVFYADPASWKWTFEKGFPATSTLQNPVASFSDKGDWDVTLKATDVDGYSCSETKTIHIGLPNPIWREIHPH